MINLQFGHKALNYDVLNNLIDFQRKIIYMRSNHLSKLAVEKLLFIEIFNKKQFLNWFLIWNLKWIWSRPSFIIFSFKHIWEYFILYFIHHYIIFRNSCGFVYSLNLNGTVSSFAMKGDPISENESVNFSLWMEYIEEKLK